MQAFLYKVAEDLKKRFGQNISQTAVVFNNKRPMIFLKKYLAQVYGQTILSPSMFTIQEFMALSTQKAIAHELSRFFLLFDCYNQLLPEDEKVNPETFFPLSQTILSDFDQIDYARVSPEALFTHLKDLGELRRHFSDFSPEQQKFLENFWGSFSTEKQVYVQERFIELWKRLPKLYSLFQQKMLQQGLISMATVYRNLAEEKADRPAFLEDFQQIIFVGFNALNRCESDLFKKWQAEGKALFYFDGDEYYVSDKMQEAGHFLRNNMEQYGLKNAMGRFPSQLNNTEKQIRIYPVSGHSAQAKTLANLLLPENRIPLEDQGEKVAVILADESLLTPVLQSISDAFKLNITMGVSIRHSPVFHFIQQWISLQQELQNQSLKPRSLEKLNDLLHIGLLGFTDAELETIQKQYFQLNHQEFINFLRHLNPIAHLFFCRQETGLQCIDALKELITLILHQKEADGRLPLLTGSLLLRTFQELNKLRDHLESYERHLTATLALSLTFRCISAIQAPIVGEPLEGIQIMGMLESRCLDFDEIYLLGANEGILPQNSQQNTFIPDSLRRAFGLPLKEDQEALSAYLFYRLCQRVNRMNIFYNSLVDIHSSGEVSRYISQLSFESNLSLNHIPEPSLITGAPEKPDRIKITKSEDTLLRLNQYVAPATKAFSPTALKTYLNCPLQFFLKYIASIPEPEGASDPLNAAIMGQAFHKIMQDFYTEFEQSGAIITKEKINSRREMLPQLCKQALYTALPESFFISNSQDSRLIIAQKILIENAKVILKHDAEKLAPFKILELESDCSLSLPMQFSGEETPQIINFKGIIDRVDEVNGRIRIVDYKTGGDSTEISGGIDSLFDTKNNARNPAAFQILFYTLLYYKKHGILPEPHLYIIRKIADETTSIHFKGKTNKDKPVFTDENIVLFEENLVRLMAAIFSKEVPFQHNPESKYCSNSAYHIFCSPEPEEEE